MERINIIPPYNQDLVTFHDPLSMISEAFKMCRTNIEFSAIDRELKSICITSSLQSEGKSITITNLAITFAQIGRRVLLVDADLRRPSVHKLFGLSNRRGLTTMLLAGAKPDDAMQATQIENLTVLTSGPIPPNPAELLMSASMNRFIERVREEYDLVLFDSPPVGAVTDAAIIATKMDGTIFVIRAGKVERKQLQRSAELLKQVKANVLGYILNGINAGNDDYYHYYYYRGSYQNDSIDGKSAKTRPAKKLRKSKQKIKTPSIRAVAMPHSDGGFGLPDYKPTSLNQYADIVRQPHKQRSNQLESEDD